MAKTDGLTKREYFIGAALTGLCANPLIMSRGGGDLLSVPDPAGLAVALADAAIDAANASTEPMTRQEEAEDPRR